MTTGGRVTTFMAGALAGATVGWFAARNGIPGLTPSRPEPTTMAPDRASVPGAGRVAEPVAEPTVGPTVRAGTVPGEDHTAPAAASDPHAPDGHHLPPGGSHGTSVADQPWATDPIRRGGGPG